MTARKFLSMFTLLAFVATAVIVPISFNSDGTVSLDNSAWADKKDKKDKKKKSFWQEIYQLLF